jgi:hypothetical protein
VGSNPTLSAIFASVAERSKARVCKTLQPLVQIQSGAPLNTSAVTFKEYIAEKNIDAPRHPGILKRQVKGKLTCSKARSLKGKGGLTAKAAQRYLNYHCQ